MPPKWDSGLKWPDPNNPLPTDLLWGGGVRGGLWWDGTLYRDATRYPAGGPLFWCTYFKPGSGPGIKNGYWINFGRSYAHLHGDDPAQVLNGASQRLYWKADKGEWRLVIEATQYVTEATVLVWEGVKHAGNDPTGAYTRVAGIDPLASLSIEAA